MKSTDINNIFSAKVAELLANGYQINTNTMSGSQGEIAKVDFRKGDDVIRVLLYRKTIWGEDFRTADAIRMTVSRCTDERAIVTGFFRDPIIWNERLEVLEERTFYKMGETYGAADWYLEGQEAEEALKKSHERSKARFDMDMASDRRIRKEYTGDAIKQILLPAVRRHLEKPKMKADRIDKITRCWKNNRFEYTITTVGKKLVVLH